MALTRVKGKVLQTSVDTIDDLPTTGYEGQVIEVLGYWTKGDGGGGTFRYDSAAIKNTHNGGTVFDPDIAAGVYTSSAATAGVWVRQYSGAVNVKWFGAKGDGDTTSATENTNSLTEVFNSFSSVFIPNGIYVVDATLPLNSYSSIIGEDVNGTIIKASGSFPIFEFIFSSINNSKVYLSSLTLKDGTYGVYNKDSVSASLNIIERSSIKNVNFETQTEAGFYLGGSKIGYYVNYIVDCVFRYCKNGIIFDGVFSANLNFFDLNRYEGLMGVDGGFVVKSVVNEEFTGNKITRSRFEALNFTSVTAYPIHINSGTQALTISDNYFEDISQNATPSECIRLDANLGLIKGTLISGNNVSANSTGVNVITFDSQVSETNIFNNAFRQGGICTITGNIYTKYLNVSGNAGVVSKSVFIGITDTEINLLDSLAITLDPIPEKYSLSLSHDGDFTFTHQLINEGVFTFTTILREDGDISLGGMSVYIVKWLPGGAPLTGVTIVTSSYNPSVTSIVPSVDASGLITVTVTCNAGVRTAFIDYGVVKNSFY